MRHLYYSCTGHALYEPTKWIFGMYDVSRKIGAVFSFLIVQQRVSYRSFSNMLNRVQKSILTSGVHTIEFRRSL